MTNWSLRMAKLRGSAEVPKMFFCLRRPLEEKMSIGMFTSFCDIHIYIYVIL